MTENWGEVKILALHKHAVMFEEKKKQLNLNIGISFDRATANWRACEHAIINLQNKFK
jgi:hypothetical protein